MQPTSQHALARRLGFWATVGLVIGVTIGSGIFRTPAAIAARVPDPLGMLGVWLLGGFISLCGALSVAELAAIVPKTGGWYAFLREGWGRLPAFLFGWSELVLIRASATGAIALVFSSYLLRSLGYDPESSGDATTWLAASAIVVAAMVNIRGVHLGAFVAGVSTALKFSALLLLVAIAFVLGGTRGGTLEHFSGGGAQVDSGLFGLALISVLWAYDGFADVAFAAGEVKDPQRTLPRAIVGGTLAIMAIYLAVNVAYLYVLPVGEIARSPLIAADTMRAVLGEVGATLVAIVVAVSTFGALIGISLAAPRVFFAMAEDGLMIPALARVHSRYATPYVAIGFAAALGIFFVLTRTFEQLADTFVLSIWPFYGLAVAGLYRLRRRHPPAPGIYSTPGYPVVPAVFLAGVLYLIGSALYGDPLWTAVTFAIVLSGALVFVALVKRDDRN